MARPDKQGIDYFPMDLDFDLDDRLSLSIAELGNKGALLYISLLSYIYKDGYFKEWNEEVQLRFVHRYKAYEFDSTFVNDGLNSLLKWGLFDRDIYSQYLLLTSKRIQSTWLEATRKRNKRKICQEIWLIDLPENFIPQKIDVIDGIKQRKRQQ